MRDSKMTPAQRELLTRLQHRAPLGPMHFVNSGGGRFALVVTDQDRGGLLRLNQSYGASTLDSLTDRGYTLVADFSTDLDYRNQHAGDTRHGWQVTLTDAGAAVRTPANTAVNTGG